ncbi:MAG: hydrogenase formation protein HypD [Rhodospirillaceae bacterium]|nr:hydrogenase formation protein HypD [Rhodospirillaceae bacterium]
MRYIDEFRDGELARGLADAIAARVRPGRTYRLMEFCGGHTHTISRYDLESLLPPAVTLIHGPGCPVCVLPIGRVDQARALALSHDVVLCCYGDVLRVPGSGDTNLIGARAAGADVRIVYSPTDALDFAKAMPDRQVVFLGIGFETTAPATAAAVLQAEALGLTNFSVLCYHVLTPPALTAILAPAAERAMPTIDGFVGPGHVSTVIGAGVYEPLMRQYAKPMVISGFEPVDILQSVAMLIDLLNEERVEVTIQYRRVVSWEGNRKAQAMMDRVFALRDSFEWRGLGSIPQSALRLSAEFAKFDAEQRFPLPDRSVADNPACDCPEILRGMKHPLDCRLFGNACTPETPVGACMVSSEGACAAYYTYGRGRPVPAHSEPEPV